METYYFPSREFPSHPTNLEKKVKLWFNLPLLHTFAEKFISELVYESQSEYFRKGDGKKFQILKFKFVTTSASVANFLSLQTTKSHLPIDFFH